MYKLLIVEDEMLLRQGIVHMLNWTEHDFLIVGQVSNGKEALECIDTLKPDIIITDIIMPVMDGVEFTRRVKNAYPEIQIVVLSSYDDFSYVRETLRLGACDYVLKREINESMILEVLKRTAKKCIGGSEIVSPRQKTRLITSLFGDPSIHPEDAGPLKEKLSMLVRDKGKIQHTFRLFHDRENEYRWIRLEGSTRQLEHGETMLYGAFSDVSSQVRLEKELAGANAKMEDIINAIPGGVAIYRVSDIFETVYFSDGVPELSGYTVEEYRKLVKGNAADMTYSEDTAMVVSRAMEVIRQKGVDDFEFRKQHRDGHIVWVRVQVKWIGEDRGRPLLHCVFHNISHLKETQMEMNHLINSIPGGIALFQKEEGAYKAAFLSDGVITLSGYTRGEYEAMIQRDALDMVYEADRRRVRAAVDSAMENGLALDVFYRIRHKDGRLVWIHMNGRRMGPLTGLSRLYIVITGMSAQTRLFQTIANEMADSIYVIDKENYDLLYVNENQVLFTDSKNCVGQKCYTALHGQDGPCEIGRAHV